MEERRKDCYVSEMGFRETDRRRIDEANMRYLTPQESADLFKVMAKINREHLPINCLGKTELATLYYGHIFTNTVKVNGERQISDEDMRIYTEFMAESVFLKYSDVDVYIYQFPRRLDPDAAKAFGVKADRFRDILKRFERILGERDRM